MSKKQKEDWEILDLDLNSIDENELSEYSNDEAEEIEMSEEISEYAGSDYYEENEYISDEENITENDLTEEYNGIDCSEAEYGETEYEEYESEETEYTESEYYEEGDAEETDFSDSEYKASEEYADEDIEFLDSDEIPEDEVLFVRKKDKKRKARGKRKSFNMYQLSVAIIALLIVVVGAVLIVEFNNQKRLKDEYRQISELGLQYASLGTIGNDGLALLGQYARDVLSGSEDETVDVDTSTIAVSFVSLSKDIKIKFFASGMIVTGKEFEVELKSVDSDDVITLVDDDKDGIIYADNLEPGDYEATVAPMDGISFVPNNITVTIKAELQYQAIDVAGEITVAAANDVEDTVEKDIEIEEEDVLEDTVDWVESTRVTADGSDGYKVIDKSSIKEPSLLTARNNNSIFENVGILGDNGYPVSLFQLQNLVRDDSTSDNSVSENESTGSIVSYQIAITDGKDTYYTGYTDENNPMKATVTKLCEGNTSTVDNPSLSWSSSNTSVATVNNGVITGVSAGTTDITAVYTADGIQYTVSRTIKIEEDKPQYVNLAGSISVTTGTPVELVANGVYVSGRTMPISEMSWKMEDETIATFDKTTGKITGLKAGTTTLTGYMGSSCDSSYKNDSITVTVTLSSDDQALETLKNDKTTPLYTKDSNEKVYIKNSSGSYVVATYSDYYTESTFYVEAPVTYIYTGWQTINGNTYFYDKNHNKVCGDQVIQGIQYHFTNDGILAMDSSGKRGIDVSVYQGNINWTEVKNSGIEFVIIRAGYRGYTQGALKEDANFKTNMSGAIAAGLKVGVYYVTQAVNEAEAVEEASAVISLVKDYGVSYPIFIDIETSGGHGSGRADNLSSATRTAVCKAFCETIRNSGYTAGVYANKSWWTNQLDYNQLNGYIVWLAQYASAPTLSGRYDIWQHSSQGSVSGISGNVDLNISYLGY